MGLFPSVENAYKLQASTIEDTQNSNVNFHALNIKTKSPNLSNLRCLKKGFLGAKNHSKRTLGPHLLPSKCNQLVIT